MDTLSLLRGIKLNTSKIRNVVFDVGNVIVRWSPVEIVRLTFGYSAHEAEQKAKAIFQHDIWMALNKGLLTEHQAQEEYQTALGLSEAECERLFYYIKETQIQIFGTVDLIKRLKQASYNIYALTDNVHEIVEHLKHRYDFWPLFEAATVSADLGVLKPSADIYQSLLNSNNLIAEETVFLDDMPYNVDGAVQCGLHAIQFSDAQQAENALRELGLEF